MEGYSEHTPAAVAEPYFVCICILFSSAPFASHLVCWPPACAGDTEKARPPQAAPALSPVEQVHSHTGALSGNPNQPAPAGAPATALGRWGIGAWACIGGARVDMMIAQKG